MSLAPSARPPVDLADTPDSHHLVEEIRQMLCDAWAAVKEPGREYATEGYREWDRLRLTNEMVLRVRAFLASPGQVERIMAGFEPVRDPSRNYCGTLYEGEEKRYWEAHHVVWANIHPYWMETILS